MAEEFLALFKSTERDGALEDAAPPEVPPAGEGPPSADTERSAAATDAQQADSQADLPSSAGQAAATPTLSPFLRSFLRRSRYALHLPSSGIPDLDTRLAGGLMPGLHLLAGHAGEEKTALMLSALWQAVSAQRPVIFYAFREGSFRVWMRLVAALATLEADSGRPALSLVQLRRAHLSVAQIDQLVHLDRLLQITVFSVVSLVDGSTTGIATPDHLLEDLRARSREAREQAKPMPLVVVDDLDRLILDHPEQSVTRALTLLGEVLEEECASGLVAATLAEPLAGTADAPRTQTVLVLGKTVETASEHLGRATLEVRANAAGGWTGTVPLLLDFSSGLFTPDPMEEPTTNPS